MTTFHSSQWLPRGLVLALALGGMAASAEPMIAINSSNGLYFFGSESPTLGALHAVTGIAAGQTLAAVDKRPLDDEMYGVGTIGSVVQLYRIDLATVAATPIGAAFDTGIAPEAFSMDFNPVVDRLRVITSAGKNLRINPITGAIAGTDTDLSFAPMTFSGPPRAVALAYTNNVANAALTVAYVIEYVNDRLMTIGKADGSESPNGGVLHDVASLGVTNSDISSLSLDISPTGRVRAVLSVGGVPGLYNINLVSGAATAIGAFPAGSGVQDIAFIGDNVEYDLLFENGFEVP